MIEVTHNPDALAYAKRVRVRNVKRAQEAIRRLMDAKRPLGMKLRHNYDTFKSLVYLEARTPAPIAAAVATLRASHNIISMDARRVHIQE